MPSVTPHSRLKSEFRSLRRLMDFASTHRSLNSPRSQLGRRLAEIYHQLGLVWEFLALQCRHEEGYRPTRSSDSVCRICGTVEGTCERWTLQPAKDRRPRQRTMRPMSAKVARPNPSSSKSAPRSRSFSRP